MRSLLLVFLLALGPAVKACSCIGSSLAGHFTKATAVFEAVVIGSRTVQTGETLEREELEITMLIGHVYKGEVSGKVVVRTSISGASCGATLPIGGRYLVFTRAYESASGTQLHTSLCSGNKHYPFWRFALRRNVRRLARGEAVPQSSKWARNPGW